MCWFTFDSADVSILLRYVRASVLKSALNTFLLLLTTFSRLYGTSAIESRTSCVVVEIHVVVFIKTACVNESSWQHRWELQVHTNPWRRDAYVQPIVGCCTGCEMLRSSSYKRAGHMTFKAVRLQKRLTVGLTSF